MIVADEGHYVIGGGMEVSGGIIDNQYNSAIKCINSYDGNYNPLICP